MSNEFEYKVSVVVLVYNTEEFLEECLDSLVNQTLKEIEIICVNDESKDGSLNILNKYAKRYDNIKVINQKNQGGANAANNGLKLCKGEYVTVVDSDDVVISDAFEKLYDKAKQTDSDIVSGGYYKYVENTVMSLNYHQELWEKERTMDIKNDIFLYDDTSYWNKLFKRQFMEENELGMIPGRLYADIPMSVLTFLKSSKTTFIPEYVYYWRKREMNTSITKQRFNIDNMMDKLGMYYILKDYFDDEEVFENVIKLLLKRFYLPINGILQDDEFKEIYLNKMREILSDINNPLDNKYGDNIIIFYTYLILNNHDDVLLDFIHKYMDVKDILYEGGKAYWNLKYFRNPEYNFPDDIFKIRHMLKNFISIGDVELDSKYLTFRNIVLPKNIKFDEVKIVLDGITFKNQIKMDNIYKFNVDLSKWDVKIPLDEIGNINKYKVYLELIYNNKIERYRVDKSMFPSKINEGLENDKASFIFNNLENSIFVKSFVKQLFNMKTDEETMKIISNENSLNYDIYLQSNKRDFVKFCEDSETNDLELIWKYSLEKNIKYNLILKIRKQTYKLTADYFTNFKNHTVPYKDGAIHIYKNKNNEIKIRWN